MKNALTLTLLVLALGRLGGLEGAAQAAYSVDAQMTSQAVGDGSYDYTIQLHNSSSSTASIGTFWFAWVPTYYGYDLLNAYPNITAAPNGWYGYQVNNSYYYPDGWSIDFYNYSGSSLAPGQTFTFGFNSTDSPGQLGQTSAYYGVPTLTSYVFDDTGNDYYGSPIVVSLAAVPEPAPTAVFGLGAVLLGWWGNRLRARA